jgi:hypothetical protein
MQVQSELAAGVCGVMVIWAEHLFFGMVWHVVKERW